VDGELIPKVQHRARRSSRNHGCPNSAFHTVLVACWECIQPDLPLRHDGECLLSRSLLFVGLYRRLQCDQCGMSESRPQWATFRVLTPEVDKRSPFPVPEVEAPGRLLIGESRQVGVALHHFPGARMLVAQDPLQLQPSLSSCFWGHEALWNIGRWGA